jgi:hypothetical protein
MTPLTMERGACEEARRTRPDGDDATIRLTSITCHIMIVVMHIFRAQNSAQLCGFFSDVSAVLEDGAFELARHRVHTIGPCVWSDRAGRNRLEVRGHGLKRHRAHHARTATQQMCE